MPVTLKTVLYEWQCALERDDREMIDIAGCQTRFSLSDKVSQESKSERESRALDMLLWLTCIHRHLYLGTCIHVQWEHGSMNKEHTHKHEDQTLDPQHVCVSGQDGPHVIATHGKWRKGFQEVNDYLNGPSWEALILSGRPRLKEWRNKWE